MLEAFFQALSAVSVLIAIAGFGYFTSMRGWYDDNARGTIARLVNLAIPCLLFSSVTSRFTTAELWEILRLVPVPFAGFVILNAVPRLILRFTRAVPPGDSGVFSTCFTSATVLFIGMPLVLAVFGEEGIPCLLIFFLAHTVFFWTLGVYSIAVDGIVKTGGAKPPFVSVRNLKLMFTPPVLAVLVSVAVVLLGIPVPRPVAQVASYMGRMTTPLALIFVGIMVQRIGFSRMRHLTRELWLIVGSCFVLRPLLFFALASAFGVDPLVRNVLVVAAALPVPSMTAILARVHGANVLFASEAVGITTAMLSFVMPLLLVILSLV